MKNAKGKSTVKNSKVALKPVDDRMVGKRKAAYKPDKSSAPKPKKDKKAKKDPNKPKKTRQCFLCIPEFRQTFKAENPNVKGVAAVGKAGGEKWKSMSSAEKAPYEAKAAKRKADYEKLMNAYNNKQESSADDESDKSKSEVNDDDEASGEDDHKEEDDDDEEEEDEDEDDDEDDD